MRFRIASLLKIVVASALLFWLWRAYGAVGVAASGVVGAMVLVPIGLARLGGVLGEPVIAGALGGAIGWGMLAIAITIVLPVRSPAPPFSTFVPVGTATGALYGLSVFFRRRASKKPRTSYPRIVIGLDLGLFVVLLAFLLGPPYLERYRPMLRSILMKSVAPAQPNSPAALP
ncbi:MAG: hypothetical protein AB7I30_17335 [Isosphaeraceae bacterium]